MYIHIYIKYAPGPSGPGLRQEGAEPPKGGGKAPLWGQEKAS